MIAEIQQTTEEWRRPGCDDRCVARRVIMVGLSGRELLPMHDPEAHEEYGVHLAGLEMGGAGLVETGLLTVDIRRCEVRVAGNFVSLTATEWRILEYLARRLDRCCPHDEMTRAIWGEQWIGYGRNGPWHLLRVNVARLRAKLSGAGWGLVATIAGRGYRLVYLPPGQVAREKPAALRTPTGTPLAPGQWSLRWSACRQCRTTEYPHHARGFCQRTSCKRRYQEALARIQACAS